MALLKSTSPEPLQRRVQGVGSLPGRQHLQSVTTRSRVCAVVTCGDVAGTPDTNPHSRGGHLLVGAGELPVNKQTGASVRETTRWKIQADGESRIERRGVRGAEGAGAGGTHTAGCRAGRRTGRARLSEGSGEAARGFLGDEHVQQKANPGDVGGGKMLAPLVERGSTCGRGRRGRGACGLGDSLEDTAPGVSAGALLPQASASRELGGSEQGGLQNRDMGPRLTEAMEKAQDRDKGPKAWAGPSQCCVNRTECAAGPRGPGALAGDSA